MSTTMSCTSRSPVSAKRSKSSMVSEKIASWKIALPDTDGRRIFLRAERISSVCDSELNESLLDLVTNASMQMPKRTKKNATGSS